MLRNHPLLFSTLTLALCGSAVGQRSPEEALSALRAGNQRFATEQSVPQPIGEGVRRTLARGQSPFAVVVTCADSQVPPEHLFNTGLGELIVVRTAGHVLGSEALATIEHAVQTLNIPLCVVLGHQSCDLVDAAIAQTASRDLTAPPTEHLSPSIIKLLERIEPSVRKARRLDLGGAELQQLCQEEHAQSTATECLRRSELLRRYASVDKFRVVAARYHENGQVEWLPTRPLPADPKIDVATLLGSVPHGLPPHVSLRMLRAGHRRFLGDNRPEPDLSMARRQQLAEGQQPLAIVVTDSDSRVSPEHVFDAGIGELYVVRTAGNTLTDETLASIEFAAGRLGASLLVVMGHNRCELLADAGDHPEQQQMTPHQRRLLKSLEPSIAAAKKQGGNDSLAVASRTNVVRTIRETRSRSALLRTLENQGKFSMLAAFYDVGSGDLHWLKAGDRFEAAQFASTSSTQHGHDDQSNHGQPGHTPPSGHGHGDESHASRGDHGDHSSHDEHGAHTAHSAHDEHGSHTAHSAHDEHGSHNEHGAATHDEHGGHDSHANHDSHAGGGHGGHAEPHGHDSHASAAHGDLPIMDFPSAPMGETSHGGAHDSHDSHDSHGAHGHEAHSGHSDESHGGESHSGHPPSSGHGDAHGAHEGAHGERPAGDGHDHGHAHPHAGPQTAHPQDQLWKRWTDPVVVVGLVGIASLLFAAVLALKRS
ncbi:MAG: carbonic anhydrase [Planctomycetota bacterium]